MAIERLGTSRWERQLREDTRLAVDGKARCRRCQRVAPQGEMFVVTLQGNVVYSACPEHVGKVTMLGQAGSVQVQYEEPKGSVIGVSSLSGALSRPNPDGLLKPAQPSVKRIPLFASDTKSKEG